eukprot:6172313-Pleurochrysis_carterae.AAC.3
MLSSRAKSKSLTRSFAFSRSCVVAVEGRRMKKRRATQCPRRPYRGQLLPAGRDKKSEVVAALHAKGRHWLQAHQDEKKECQASVMLACVQARVRLALTTFTAIELDVARMLSAIGTCACACALLRERARCCGKAHFPSVCAHALANTIAPTRARAHACTVASRVYMHMRVRVRVRVCVRVCVRVRRCLCVIASARERRPSYQCTCVQAAQTFSSVYVNDSSMIMHSCAGDSAFAFTWNGSSGSLGIAASPRRSNAAD